MPKITIVTFEGTMDEVVNYHRLLSRPYQNRRNNSNLREVNSAHSWRNPTVRQNSHNRSATENEVQDMSASNLDNRREPPQMNSMEDFPPLNSASNSRNIVDRNLDLSERMDTVTISRAGSQDSLLQENDQDG